jgi:hypothetical protein
LDYSTQAVIPVKTGIQRPRIDTPGFPASSAGQALLKFIPMKIGTGMTNAKATSLNFRSLKMCQNSKENSAFLPGMRLNRTAMVSK